MKRYQIAFEYPNMKGALKEYIEADGYFNNGLVEFYVDGDEGREIIAAYGISKVIRIKNQGEIEENCKEKKNCKKQKRDEKGRFLKKR